MRKASIIDEHYGEMVKSLRINAGLTQQDVANALDVTPGYISHVENNRTAMSLRMLVYYAKIVGLTLDELVGQLEPSYEPIAIDKDILRELSTLNQEQKQALLKTIRIWKKVM